MKMKKVLLFLLLAFFLTGNGLTAFGATINPGDYWVLEDGYSALFSTEKTLTVTEKSSSGENLFSVNFMGTGTWTQRYDASGNLLMYGSTMSGGGYFDVVNPQKAVLFPSEMVVGMTHRVSWQRNEYGGGAYQGSDSVAVTLSGPETVTVPAGTYATYKFVVVDVWADSWGDRGTTKSTFWLAQGIGWVKVMRNSVTYELQEHEEGPPGTPTMTLTTSGTRVSLSWSAAGATGYRLFYAPYPAGSPTGVMDMGGSTSFSIDLSVGAAYYVFVQAYNSYGYSGYSSIDHFTITYTNSLGMTFILLPAGTFTMGSPSDEPGRDGYEGPQHQVTLTQPFYMQQTEVTQAQWEAVMGRNPSSFSGCPSCPVENVTWNDVVYTFIGYMNARGEGTYNLPTEAQWEYAARAGSTTAFYNGGITETGAGYDPNLNAIGWYTYNSGSETHPVAQKTPNAWGLYGMSGNVWEWCWDWHGSSYDSSPSTDPAGPTSGWYRVIRGGGWFSYAGNCRSAFRSYSSPDFRSSSFGFRLTRQP
jgi:formylglycine-generating enzyme required for sulfatase activity